MLIAKNRASAILYEFIISNREKIDTVILPINVCEIVPLVYLKAGIEIKFVDISLTTLAMEFEEEILKNAKVLIHYVRSYGCEIMSENERLIRLKKKYENIIIVDDRCLCKPILKEENIVGDITLYSTGYAKYVDFNGGAFAFINSKFNYNEVCIKYYEEDLYELKQIFKLGKEGSGKIKIENINSNWLKNENISNVNEYLINIQNEVVIIEQRKEKLNQIYKTGLKKEVQLPDNFNIWRFNILIKKNREKIIKKIFENNLFVSMHYKSLGQFFKIEEKFKNAELIEKEIINLFNDKYYTLEQAERTVEIINKYS